MKNTYLVLLTLVILGMAKEQTVREYGVDVIKQKVIKTVGMSMDGSLGGVLVKLSEGLGIIDFKSALFQFLILF